MRALGGDSGRAVGTRADHPVPDRKKGSGKAVKKQCTSRPREENI